MWPCSGTPPAVCGLGWSRPPTPTSTILSSRTELNLHQMAESSAFGMGLWSKVSGRFQGALLSQGQGGR